MSSLQWTEFDPFRPVTACSLKVRSTAGFGPSLKRISIDIANCEHLPKPLQCFMVCTYVGKKLRDAVSYFATEDINLELQRLVGLVAMHGPSTWRHNELEYFQHLLRLLIGNVVAAFVKIGATQRVAVRAVEKSVFGLVNGCWTCVLVLKVLLEPCDIPDLGSCGWVLHPTADVR